MSAFVEWFAELRRQRVGRTARSTRSSRGRRAILRARSSSGN